MDPDDLLAALDPEQRQVALASRGPVCVLAGAGTGKTRAITHRIAYAVATGMVNPAHVLALTFTVRAAGELRGRLRALGGGAEAVRAATFHSAALRQLSYFWPKVIGGRPPKLVESKLPLLREAARDLGLSVAGAALAEAVTEIEWAKVCQTHPDSYVFAAAAAGRAPAAGVEEVGRLYQAYEALRRDRQLIDFEAVLELTAAILLTEPLVAHEVHSAFRYFTVDEFQDVNPLQKLLLDAWLGGREELCVVGDPQQTIYSFTGATSEYLRGFAADFPSATVVRLVRDYRSTPQVVAAANRLTAGGVAGGLAAGGVVRGARGATADRAGSGGDAVPGRGGGGGRGRRRGGGADQGIRAGPRDRHPAADQCARGAVRAGAGGREACRTWCAGPSGSTTGPRSARRWCSSGARPAPRAPAPTRPGCRESCPPPSAMCSRRPGSPRCRRPRGGAVRERWESLAAIAGLAEDLAASRPGATLAEFAAELAEREETGHAPVAAAVTLATMHAAKGLEWDAVLIPGLVEGIMPIVHARTAEAIEEERRLLYVAVTRARVRLALSWAPARTPGAEAARQRSRFLAASFRVTAAGGRAAGGRSS